ncbi:MAG: hypothetical protein ACJ76V_13990 [Thermoleophilaceae bacterium]
MSEANQSVVEQLRRARDTEDDLSAALQAHLRVSSPGELRDRLAQRLTEVQLEQASLTRRLSSLEPGPSPLDIGVALATLPLRAGLGVARLALAPALAAVRLPLEMLLGGGGGEPDPAVRHASAEQRAAAVFGSLQRTAESSGDAVTASLAERARAGAERTLSLLDGGPPEPQPRPPRRPPPTRPAPRGNGGSPPEPTPPAPPIPDEQQHVSEEATVVAEFAEQGAEEGAGAEVSVEEPWDGYGRMKAQDIIARLDSESDEVVAVVQLYETFHRKRQTVLRAAERRLKVGPEG